MRPRCRQDAVPKPASGYNILRQVIWPVHLRAGRDMVKAEHLRRAVDGLQHQFVALHEHEALLLRRRCFHETPHAAPAGGHLCRGQLQSLPTPEQM
eukprot:1032798-Pleurochrysis_carterae.AAC.6